LVLNLLHDGNETVRIEALRDLRGLPPEKKSSAALLRLAEESRRASDGAIAENLEWAEQLRRAWGDTDKKPLAALPSAPRPEGTQAWWEQVKLGGDPAAGRRTFFHLNSAGCYRCHTIDGRGGRVGPDLSTIARTMDRRKLAESILEPSREISPQFTPWTVVTTAGQVHNGIVLAEENERILLGTSEGKTLDLADRDIEERSPSATSIMPEKLIDQLTVEEFRNLLAFLETLK
jgi:hypothetical protein